MHVLKSQPHQVALYESHLMGCDELCGHCGGEWRFYSADDKDDDDVGERTGLTRCKDCGGAFHVS